MCLKMLGKKANHHYLSVSEGTIRIRSFGLNSRALSMNLFAKAALTPNGGFSPMIYTHEVHKGGSQLHLVISHRDPNKVCHHM